MANPNFSRIKDQVLFVGNYMEVFLPKSYFDQLAVAWFTGHKVNTMGIFEFQIFADPENPKSGQKHIFRCPATIVSCPSGVETLNREVTEDSDETAFIKLKYYKNDVFIDNVYILQATENVKAFFELLINGKMPSLIPYDMLLKVVQDCIKINKVNLGSPSTTFEIIIAEICRDKNSIYDSFRFRCGKPGDIDMTSYIPINIKNLSRFNSTFSAVTFEDIDYSLTTSINKLRQNKTEKESPLEKTIKF